MGTTAASTPGAIWQAWLTADFIGFFGRTRWRARIHSGTKIAAFLDQL
jgi:hypothetical protein